MPSGEPTTDRSFRGWRRHDPGFGCYFTPDDFAATAGDNERFVVGNAGTGEDAAPLRLKQHIVERGSHG